MRLHRSDRSLLAEAELFAGYDDEQLAPVARHVDRVVVLPGTTIAEAGRRPHEVVVVLSGEAHLVGGPGDGEVLGPGAVIGAVEEVADAAHATTVVAGSALSALVMTGPAFRWAVQSLPGLHTRLGLTQPIAASVDSSEPAVAEL